MIDVKIDFICEVDDGEVYWVSWVVGNEVSGKMVYVNGEDDE